MEVYKSHGLIESPTGTVIVVDPVGSPLCHYWKAGFADWRRWPLRPTWASEPVVWKAADFARKWIDAGCPLAEVQEGLNTLHVRWGHHPVLLPSHWDT